MSLAQLLADHGYLAVFVGSLLEGETILVLAGFAAHQGLLSLPLTLTIAFIGGTLGDQLFFWLGHTWGASLLRRIPGSDRRVRRVRELLSRYDALLIVGIRFMYGLRRVGLSIVRKAVERQGGTVSAESSPGGACFRMLFRAPSPVECLR